MNSFMTLLLIGLALLPNAKVAGWLATGLAEAGNLPNGIAQPLAPSYKPVPVPTPTTTNPPPLALSAASWYAVDVGSGTVMASNQADTPRPIASITKLATALVIVHDYSPNQVVTVPPLPAYQPDDEVIGLKAGEQFTMRDLLTALLVNSADDAADALALADSGTEAAFVAKMNRAMSDWGVSGAHFSNPSGLVDTDNEVSARAVAQLGLLVLHNQLIRQLVATPSATITDSTGRRFTLTATDQLLQHGQFQGIKTGYTAAAGQCFVGLAAVQGHQVVTVVLGSQDRFGDTLKLIDWIATNYQWHAP